MNNLDFVYIKGIIYTEVDEKVGPQPVAWLPTDLDSKISVSVGIKAITLLTAEYGQIPEDLAIIPFPSLQLKGIIKYIQWKDEKLRGSLGTGDITVLFNQADDVIFYKYIEEIESILDATAKSLKSIEEAERNSEMINSELITLGNSIETLLEQFKRKEKRVNDQSKEQISKLKDDLDFFQFKIIIAGNPSVGKTSIVARYVNKVFERNYIPTLGVNVISETLTMDQDTVVQLVLWDIAGQSKFETMRRGFYKGARGAFFVFDLTNLQSFESISNWYKDVKSNLDRTNVLLGFLIGNKNDLNEERKISGQEATQLAENLNLEYFETSALTGKNVEIAFEQIARKLLEINR